MTLKGYYFFIPMKSQSRSFKMLSVYSLRPEDVLGFYLNKRPCKFLKFFMKEKFFSFVCEMCAETMCVHTHKIQEKNQLLKLECE